MNGIKPIFWAISPTFAEKTAILWDIMKKTDPKPKYKPLDRVTVNGRPGMVLQQTPNLFLMRPGNIYIVELDNGEKIEAREEELTP